MSSLKEVVKNTLLKLQKEGEIATPDLYRETFCLEAKRVGLSVEDCQWQARWSQKFDPKTRAQIQAHPIKTPEEFIALIAGILTRLGSTEGKEMALVQRDLLRAVLRFLATIPEVAELAKETLFKLDENNDSKTFVLMRDRWLERLKNRGEEAPKEALFARLLEPLLAPSIASCAPQEVLELKTILRESPLALFEAGFEKRLESALVGRIAADKHESNRKGLELSEVIEVLVAKLASLAQTGIRYQDELSHIGKTLEEITLDPKSLEEAKGRLIAVTHQIDNHIKTLHSDIDEKRSEIEFLSSMVDKLTHELREAKEEASIDPLTGIHTRRFMEETINRLEALFLRYQSRYSVAFFDLDYFKKINDKYGHEAGDRVLATFGRLIKKSIRQEDVAARYGGEEFVVILPELGLEEAWRFAERIRTLVESSVFVYQDMRIKVSVSGGVAERGECLDRKNLLNLADSRLYEAKEQGRNQIQPPQPKG